MFYKNPCVDRVWIRRVNRSVPVPSCLDVTLLFSCRCSFLTKSEEVRLYSEPLLLFALMHHWTDQSGLRVVVGGFTKLRVDGLHRCVGIHLVSPCWENKPNIKRDQTKHANSRGPFVIQSWKYCLHLGSIVFVKCKGMKKTFAVITVLKVSEINKCRIDSWCCWLVGFCTCYLKTV